MAAVEQAALEDALYHLRVARTYSGVLFIGVVISIGSHAAEYWDSAAWLPWVVHWCALWFGAGTLIAMLLVLHYAVRRGAAVQPGLAVVQPGVLLGYAAGVLGAQVGAPAPLAAQPAGGGQPPAAGAQPAVGVPQAHQG